MLAFDVHAHAVPTATDPLARRAAEALMAHEGFVGTVPGAGWTLPDALSFMDVHGIRLQLLSMPGALDAEQAHTWNVQTDDLISDQRDRFGLLAALPMGEPARAVDEIRWAVDHGADGAAIASNYDGRYLGDADFDPVFAALGQANLPVFVHPALPAGFDRVGLGRPGPLVEYPMDTARTVVDAVFAGLFLRHTGVRMILAHGGGVLPALSERIALLGTQPWVANPHGFTRTQLETQLSGLYLDTAIGGGPASLAPAIAMVGVDHLVFGTDYPPAGLDTIDTTIDNLEATLGVADRLQLEQAFAGLFPGAVARSTARHLMP